MDYFLLDNIKITSSTLEKLENALNSIFFSDETNIHIVTFNLDFYYTSSIDKHFLSICQGSSYVIPDGIGIVFFIWLKYKQKIKRITGNDLVKILLRISNKNNYRIGFLGSSQQVVDKLAALIMKDYPAITIVSLISPPLNFEFNQGINDRIVNRLALEKLDILFVALGSPRQEFWIDNHKEKINARIYVGVGAALDFYTGFKKRSPYFIQKIGFEWLWRFFTEPKRLFKRYFIHDLPFLFSKTLKIIFHNE